MEEVVKGSPPALELCATPSMLSAYTLYGKTVVVADVFRSTSTILAALKSGVRQVVLADSLDKCLALGDLGFVTVGERAGKQLPGCKLGNSPRAFLSGQWKDEKIALTSTNGASAILAAKEAKKLIIAGFLNLKALIERLIDQPGPTLFLCSGWKGTLSPEDFLCAGALAEGLQAHYTLSDDARLAMQLYTQVKNDLAGFLRPFSSTQNLQSLGAEADMDFSLQLSIYDIIPYYAHGYIEIEK